MDKKTIPEQYQFFMRISNPNTFRRNLLGASGLTLKILRQTYRVNQVREIKYVLMNKIRKEIRELKVLVYRTNELVPSYTKEELKRMFPKVSIPSRAIRGRKAEPKLSLEEHVSDLGKISRTLEEIQRRLQNL